MRGPDIGDTIFHRIFANQKAACKFAKRLREAGVMARIATIDGDACVWVKGRVDERKIIESIEIFRPEIDWHENVTFAMDLCSFFRGGCENCPRLTECRNWYDGKINCFTHLPWTEEHYKRAIREFQWFNAPVSMAVVK